MIRKKILLSILSLTLIVSVTAFTQIGKSNDVIAKSKNTARLSYYFAYTGPASPTSFSDYTDPDNYVLINEEPYEVCEWGEDALCVIICVRYWDGFAWKPDFSNTSYPSTYSQLEDYYYLGVKGLALILKSI